MIGAGLTLNIGFGPATKLKYEKELNYEWEKKVY